MVDVQHLKDKGIPLRVDGITRYVRGTTKYTTCSDVVKMVLKKTGVGKEYRHLFAIYEVSLHEEKQLPSKSRIVKVIESWCGLPNKLVLRKTEPIPATNTAPVDIETKKEKLKGKKAKSPVRNEAYVQTLISLAKFVEKQKKTIDEHILRTSSEESTTDSDSSMDEFLSSLDKSKMAGFVHFFAAMAGGKQKDKNHTTKHRTKSSSRPQASDTDESPEHSPIFSRRHHWRNRNVIKGKQHARNSRKSKKPSAGDIHPNKMHKVERIERINFGFIDVEPNSRDQVYTHVSKDENQNALRDPRSRLHPAKPCTARRRLLVGNRKSRYSLDSKDSTNSRLFKDTSSSTSEEEHMTVGTFKPIQPVVAVVARRDRMSLPGGKSAHHGTCDIAELHCNVDLLTNNGNTSLDLDQAFMLNCNITNTNARFNSTCERLQVAGQLNGCEFSPILDTKAYFSQKLVDYTITDNEADETESDIDSACSKCSFNSGFTSQSSHSSNVRETSLVYSDSDSDVINTNNFKRFNKMADNDFDNAYHVTNMAGKVDISDYIRSVFSQTSSVNEDEAMNSFMKSILCEDDSYDDEGVSSMESGLENSVRL